MENRISVIVITLNEEKNLGRCLDSVTSVADEIIVIDSFSTDGTQKVSEKFNAKFIQHEWTGINDQRNYSLQFAANDYVLSLDADEVLSEDLQAKILKFKSEGFGVDGYIFNRVTSYCDQWIRHGTWYPDCKLRLFNKNKGSYKGIDPHDEVVLEDNGKTLRVKNDILHYSYASIEEHLDVINKFTSVSAVEKHKKGKKTNVLLHLVIYPFWTFFRTYFLKLGLFDGYYGFVISVLDSYYRFLKYIKLKRLYSE